MTRKPLEYVQTVPYGEMLDDMRAPLALDRMQPDQNSFLGVCRVVQVNYVEDYLTLRTLIGSDQEFVRVAVPLTHPGAGARHILTSMPMVGDHCVVGWMAQESSEGKGGTKSPVILAWIVPGVWAGHDWLTTSGFTEDEFDQGSSKNREILRGAYDRLRHKLMQRQPGNILASSAQGSDLILDESATLTNRRGLEFILRDQDQAMVFRSMQQFHAMAGVRLYSGQVQRDATFLSPTMISDGSEWDGPQQSFQGEPVHESALPPSQESSGFLTPARGLARGELPASEGYLSRSVLNVSSRLDPYTFLQQGGFIDESGYAVDGRVEPDAMYGGKAIYRVAAQAQGNAALDPDKPTLTEWRLELAHTSDGRLPVTEQTDFFDADRIPRTDGQTSDPKGIAPGASYFDLVYGSVVGNDAFSAHGRRQYGLPLVLNIFDGDTPSPRISAAGVVANPQSGSIPTPIEDHAATLLRMSPQGSKGAPDTFWGLNKRGQFRASLSGPQTGDSAQVALRGGLKLAVGGKLDLQLTGGVKLGSKTGDAQNNVGVDLSSERGAVKIYGGGAIKGSEAFGSRLHGGDEPPAVDVEGAGGVRIKARDKVLIKGELAEVNGRKVQITGLQEVQVQAADRIGLSAKQVDVAVVGKGTFTFTGPKDFLPTSGPLEERTYTNLLPGFTASQSTFTLGSRDETFYLGSHTTTIRVGNFDYTTNLGNHSVTAGFSNILTTPLSISMTTPGSGGVVIAATAGAASLTGSAAVAVTSLGGAATVRGGLGVYLNGPVDYNFGPIICAGSLDPLTGLPFATWGQGAKFHQVLP